MEKNKTISELVNLRERLSSSKQGNKSNARLFKVFEKIGKETQKARGKKQQ